VYEIEFKPKASRQLRKIAKRNTKAYSDIKTAILTLKKPFAAAGVKKLQDHDYQYRLKVNDYRVLYNVDKEISIVAIEEVKKRDENTY
jgi:mRNA-degrading endonuclease RelE of RelBE toxin-antitoxin system